MRSNRAGVTTSKREDLTIATKLIRAALAAFAIAAVAACSSGGTPLSGGLTARMDQRGASLNRTEALGILNAYRSTTGTAALSGDTALDTSAQNLAADYARTGNAPSLPAGARAMRVSAGYANFAETFSGWRNSPADAAVIADGTARRAGLGVAYDPNSTYGVYWVLLLAD